MGEQTDQAKKENPKSKKDQEKQMRDARGVDIALNGIQAAGISKILIPSLEMYLEEEKSIPGLSHKDALTIWNKISAPDWRKIASWEKLNDVMR